MLQQPLNKIRSIGLDASIINNVDLNELIIAYLSLKWTSEFVEKHPSVRDSVMDALMENEDGDIALQKIFESDRFLLKGIRTAITDILIKCGLADISWKASIGDLYGASFPGMLGAYLDGLREPDTSLVHFSVQLLTVSSVLSNLLATRNFFERLCLILGKYIADSDWYTKSFVSNFSMATGIFRYIFKDPNFRHNLVDPLDFFRIFFESILAPFEMMNDQKRELHQHVEYESVKWTSSFTIHIVLAELLLPFISTFDANKCEAAIQYIASTPLKNRDATSFHSIILTTLSHLIRQLYVGSGADPEIFRHSIMRCFASYYDDFFDRAMNILSLCCEVELSMWIRNGVSMDSQV